MSSSELALHRLAHALREVVDVVGVQASHGNTTISSHVNVCLLSQSLGLRLRETGEAEIQTSSVNIFRTHSYDPAPEHANLVNNVIPVARRLELLR